MLDKQSKNIIKAVVAVMLSVLFGEGVFGLGLYWPFLLILLDWSGVYWFSLLVGVLISSLYHMPIGLPSLFMVTVIGALSFLIGSRRETGVVMLLIALAANLVFDKVFGIYWSVWEVFLLILAWTVSVRWFESETIKLSY